MAKRTVPEDFTTGFTPIAKTKSQKDLEEFLLQNYHHQLNSIVSKEAVRQNCLDEKFPAQLLDYHSNLARSITRIFNPKERGVLPVRSYSKNQWLHLTRTETKESIESESELKACEPNFMEFPAQPHVYETQQTELPKSDTQSSQPMVTMDVSVKEAIAIRYFRESNWQSGIESLMDDADEWLLVQTINILKREVKGYSNRDALLGKTSPADLQNFSILSLRQELELKCPKMVKVMDAICVRQDHQRKLKAPESLKPAVTSVIAKCLGIYNDSLSAYRYVLSATLKKAGTTEKTMDHLASLYDTMSAMSRCRKLLDYVKPFNEDIRQ